MKKISEKTIKRLSIYYRYLHFLSQQGTATISSRSLADLLATKPTLIRKDLSYFGGFGKKGAGYNVVELKDSIARILGIEKVRKVAIIGVGNLGMALAAYRGFEVLGFQVVVLFDNNPNKIGKKYRGKICYDIKELSKIVRKEQIEMAVLTVPAEAAQATAALAVSSGIKSILNFAPVHLNVPRNINVSNIDLASELKSLSYFLSETKKGKKQIN